MLHIATPAFTTPNSSVIPVTKEGVVRFNCKGEGMPEVTYEWFYENKTGELWRVIH